MSRAALPEREHAELRARIERIGHEVQRSSFVAPTTLDPVFQHLERRRIPQTRDHRPTVADRQAVSLALLSIGTFRDCGRHLESNSGLRLRVTAQWPDVWAWCQYLLVNCVDTPVYSSHWHDMSIEGVAKTFITFAQCSLDLRRVMARTPAFLETVTHYWLEEEYNGYDPQALGKDDAFTRVFEAILDRRFESVDLTGVFRAVGGKRGLARAAIRRLKASLVRAEANAERAFGQLVIIQHLCFKENSALHNLLLCNGLVPLLVRILGACSIGYRTRHPDIEAVEVRTSMQMSATMLRSACYRTSDGLQWVQQAIDSGLLKALLEFKDAIEDGESEDANIWRSMYGGVLAQFLVFRPVIRAVSRELKYLPRQTGPLRSPLTGAWEDHFLPFIRKRQDIKASFDAKYLKRCKYCQKSVTEKKSSMKECSACQGPRYCSKACQRSDWVRHKEECTAHVRRDTFYTTKNIDPHAPFMPLREQQFIDVLTKEEISSRRVEVSRLLVAQRSSGLSAGPAFDDFLFTVNFDKYFPELGVSTDRKEKGKHATRTVATVHWGSGTAQVRCSSEGLDAVVPFW